MTVPTEAGLIDILEAALLEEARRVVRDGWILRDREAV